LISGYKKRTSMDYHKKFEEEINFKDVFKHPLRLFGYFYILFILLILLLGIFFVKHLDAISFNAQIPTVSDSTVIIEDIPLKRGGVQPSIDLQSVKETTQELLSKGKELFDVNCQSCHGSSGQGDGPASAALKPPPRNFSNKEGWTNTYDVVGLFQTLQEGIIKNGMIAYEYLPLDDRFAMIHYITTLGDFYPEITDEELNELDLIYNLSEGIFVPHQIPVSMAIEKILSENYIKNKELNRIYELITSENGSKTGAKLLQNNCYDLKRVITTFNSFSDVDFKVFVEKVLSNFYEIGFNAGIVDLTQDELRTIYNYLQETIKIS
jgi:hypothetical protein